MKKFAKKTIIVVHIIFTWCVLIYLGYAYFINSVFKWDYRELERIESPDSKFEAVVIHGTGVLDAEAYGVCIVGKGEPFNTDQVNLDTTDSPLIEWESPSNLVAYISSGNISVSYFKPIWPSDSRKKTLVNIELRMIK